MGHVGDRVRAVPGPVGRPSRRVLIERAPASGAPHTSSDTECSVDENMRISLGLWWLSERLSLAMIGKCRSSACRATDSRRATPLVIRR
jgi:hypothetical protein